MEMCCLSLIILSALTFSVRTSNCQCTNYTEFALNYTGVEGSQIWKSKVLSLEHCMKMCVRRTACNSMNYNLETKLCELNNATLDNGELKSGKSLLYAEFDWLPAELDRSCYSRPCNMNEVCIPSHNVESCSFYCMPAGRKVCPMPTVETVGGRYIGDVIVVNCAKGYTGNDSATCLPSRNWSKEVTGCEPIFGYSCIDDELCSGIGGVCSNWTCACGPSQAYDAAIKECVLDCGEPPLVNNAIASGNQSVMTYECESEFFQATNSQDTIVCTQNGWEPSNNFFECFNCREPPLVYNAVVTGNQSVAKYECDNGYFQTTSSQDTLICTQNGWEPLNNYFECFTCGTPPTVVGASLSGTEYDKVRTYTCDDNIKPKSGTTNGTITCVDGFWEPEGFECSDYGLRMVPVVQPDHAPQFNHIGYLEIFLENRWGYVAYDHWTWEVTKVACRDVNSSLIYGGTFHEGWYGETHPSDKDTLDLHNIVCTGNEASLTDCVIDEIKTKYSAKNVVITCFDFDVMGATYVYLQPVFGESYSILMINLTGIHGAVCHDSGWSNGDEGLVACNTIHSGWTATYNGDMTSTDSIIANDVKCFGDEPHFLYCQNAGWGYAGSCNEDERLTIKCEP